MVDTLKDYAIKAIVNTVDHLGAASNKVDNIFDNKVEEVSGSELRVSCIEQVLFHFGHSLGPICSDRTGCTAYEVYWTGTETGVS